MAIDKAILFSGGRQSIVLLHILEPWLDECLVLWANTGAAYESTQQQMRAVRKSVPNFQEIRTDQPKDIARWGYPTDIFPVRHGSQQSAKAQQPLLQTTTACCIKNIWLPLSLACQDKKIDKIYCGGPSRKMDKYIYPLSGWTAEQLQNYIDKHKLELPAYYATEPKSRDCWNCTGYLWQRKEAITNLIYNDKALVKQRLEEIQKAVYDEYQVLSSLQ